MNYAALLAMLQAHPRSFLRNHYLKITVPGGGFGQPNYYFGGEADFVNPGQVVRRGASIFTRGSKVLKFVPHAWLFLLAPGDNGLPVPPTTVWLVPVEFANTVPNFAAMAGGLVTGGSNIMITALLNGCSFCCADSPGGVLMKHIRPIGAMNHAALANRLAAVGAYVGQPPGAFVGETPGTFRFFGSGGHGYDEGTEDVTVVGVRRAGNWGVYAQVHPRNVNAIRRVTKFYQE